MAAAAVQNKYERMIQTYNWYRTARLNVLYYAESLKCWTRIALAYDIAIAITGGSSPFAFWKHSPRPIAQQGWFYLTIAAAALALLKPILRLESRVRLYAELHTHYCDLYMDLKCLIEDVTVARDLTQKTNSAFEHCRSKFKELERKGADPNTNKIRRLEARVNEEININNCWFPPEHEEINA
jgi:hypothetical protein